jgi:6-phosphogluconate dehydrogenase
MKAVAAMRNQFGGHALHTDAPPGGDVEHTDKPPAQASAADEAGAGDSSRPAAS